MLEAMVCQAKLLDTAKPRYGKTGPARQGQLGHRLAESYIQHLNRTRQPTDFEVGAKMWSALKVQANAEDEAAVEDAITSLILDNEYSWAVDASDLRTERQRYFTVPDRVEIPQDRVHLLDGPVFRVTCDLTWHGRGPLHVDGASMPAHHVLDWKFHRIIEHVSSPDTNRQLLRYASALYGPEFGDTVSWLGFPRKSYFEHTIYTPDQRAAAWDEYVVSAIAMAEKMIERAPPDPERTVGTHCRYCDLLLGCDAATRYPYVQPWTADATREEKLTALIVAKKLVSALSSEVKLDLNEHGPLVDSDTEAGIAESESLSFDRDTVVKVLGDRIPIEVIDGMFVATKSRVEKAMTKAKIRPAERSEIISLMRPTAERKLTSRIRIGAAKQEREHGDGGGDGEGSA